MDFLAATSVRREMLFTICEKTGIVALPNLRKDQIRKLIRESGFPEEEISEILEDLLEDRRKASSVDRESASASGISSSAGTQPRTKVSDILKGYSEGSDFLLFLTNFERTCTLHKIERKFWVSCLLGLLPVEANETVARLDGEVAFDFDV
jgi:hypothetical protein